MDARILDKDKCFDVRVAAIVRKGNKLLVQKKINDNYLFLPGGKIEVGELLDEALKREFKEETGLTGLNVNKLMGVVENFYESKGYRCHSLNIYYSCSLKENCPLSTLERWEGAEKEKQIEYVWVELNEENIPFLRPVCLKYVVRREDFFHLVCDPNEIHGKEGW